VLAACSGDGSSGTPGGAAPQPTVDQERTHSLPSQQTGITYGITVFVPAGYDTSRDVKPALYVLDRELQYSQARDLALAQGLDTIVIAVSNGSPERRFIDFELPGAQAYYRFLTLELIPFIEAQYRVDRARRTLLGYSLSGLMATLTLFMEEPSNRHFSSMVVTDASFQFHTDATIALEQAMYDRSRALPVALSMCYTTNQGVFAALPEKIATRGYQGLRMRQQYYPLSHGDVLVPCIRDGLQFIFGAH
jgi:hypothetical protein